ncbi:hypothetical protein J7K74_01575 [Candidatus Woesearchaeota archaeon]|nr:hypothetical protein [Candidatus Woesearchaeota archaeon]
MPRKKTQKTQVKKEKKKAKRTRKKEKWYKEKVGDGKEFVLVNSVRIYSIKQLADELLVMDESTYYYHTGQGRNDFYNWIKDVFGLGELAEEILKARNSIEAAARVYKYIMEH